jgi:dihydrofolate reductase
MRRIVAGLFMSLDGVVESPDQWSMPYFNDQVGRFIGSSMESSDAMLLGRRTYEEWAEYWPGKTTEDDPFASYINAVPKFVVSTTLKSVEWQGSTLISGDIGEGITRLKEEDGKDIAISGSITLVGSLLRDGLLDELSLLVSPIVVGHGQRLFEDPSQHVPLSLVESTAFSNGVLALRYARAEA